MKLFQKVFINAIVGTCVGVIIAVLLIAWPFAPRGFVDLWWTDTFLIRGVIWGATSGAILGIVPFVKDKNLINKIIFGAVIGIVSGGLFGFSFALSFSAEKLPELLEIVVGISVCGLAGALSGASFHRIHSLIIDSRFVEDIFNHRGQWEDTKSLSRISGMIIGAVIGAIIALMLGAILITPNGEFFRRIVAIYVLPIIGGCLGGVYGHFRPLTALTAQKAIEGLKNGVLFGVLAIIYFAVLFSSLVLFMEDFQSWSFIPVIFMVALFGGATMGLGLITGMLSEIVEQSLAEIRLNFQEKGAA